MPFAVSFQKWTLGSAPLSLAPSYTVMALILMAPEVVTWLVRWRLAPATWRRRGSCQGGQRHRSWRRPLYTGGVTILPFFHAKDAAAKLLLSTAPAAPPCPPAPAPAAQPDAPAPAAPRRTRARAAAAALAPASVLSRSTSGPAGPPPPRRRCPEPPSSYLVPRSWR
jgi:hypothetical protein